MNPYNIRPPGALAGRTQTVKKLCFLTEFLLRQGYTCRFDVANLQARQSLQALRQKHRACRCF